ncbi:T9SS type A sorting domain-containing protein [Salibacter halophilus]|uniref:T9SS type A sorting domain-containing protein n=1 Tax=Salibacter halophilus TaxID=1803916 RepID=A0A6N6MCR1_9FLAO|nr:T9SS type A sorting domain-containing protein [Salibacter halophilus]KAB1066303.1 T9SS type A sorting domain-containing protein [Salibacter halophilus]
MKKILLSLFAITPLFLFGTQYHSIGSNSWSYTKNGSDCGCSPSWGNDSIFVYHYFSLNNLNLNSGSYIYVGPNGELEAGNNKSWNINTTIRVDSAGLITSNNGLTITINGSGALIIEEDGEFSFNNNLVFTNNGTFILNGDMNGQNNATITFQGGSSVEINGELDINHGANITNSTQITGSGSVNYSGNFFNQNQGNINGCSGCSTNSPIYLATQTPSGEITNVTIFDQGSWNNGTPTSSLHAQVLDDLTLTGSSIIAKSLLVNKTATLTIRGSQHVTVDDSIMNEGLIIIEDGASLVQTGNTYQNNGSGTYRLFKAGTPQQTVYNKWSAPMPNQSIVEVFHDANLYDLFAFETSSQSWKYDFGTLNPTNDHSNSPYSFGNNHMVLDADGIMDIGRGYFAPGKVNPQRLFENNVINNGDYSINIETTNNSTPGSWGGNDWNLVGNPYPSPINIQDFLSQNYNGGAGNIANAVYFWDGPNAQYITKNNTDNELMSSVQGFWVDAVNNGTISFSNSMRDHASNITLRSGGNNFDPAGAYLQIEQGSLSDYIRVYFDPMAENGMDNLYDAKKLENSNGFNFYSILDDQYMVFQSVLNLEEEEQKIIPIGLSTGSDNEITVSIDSLLNWPDNYKVYLHDLKTIQRFELNDSNAVTLQLDSAGTYDDRFVLSFFATKAAPVDPPTGLTEMNDNIKEPLYLTKNNGFEIVNTTNSDIERMTVHTITGRLALEHSRINTGDRARAQLDQNGVYIITTYFSNGQTQNKKLIVH